MNCLIFNNPDLAIPSIIIQNIHSNTLYEETSVAVGVVFADDTVFEDSTVAPQILGNNRSNRLGSYDESISSFGSCNIKVKIEGQDMGPSVNKESTSTGASMGVSTSWGMY